MFWLVPWRVSGLPTSYSPPPADPIRGDQSLIHPTFHATQERKKRRKLNWLFIYLDDYWLLIRSLQTTNQIRGSLYLSDLRGHWHFFNIWTVRNYSFTQLLSFSLVLSSRRTRVPGFCEFFVFFLSLSSTPLKTKIPLYTSSNFQIHQS